MDKAGKDDRVKMCMKMSREVFRGRDLRTRCTKPSKKIYTRKGKGRFQPE